MFDIAWMIHNDAESWNLERMHFNELKWKPTLMTAVDLNVVLCTFDEPILK